MYQCRTVSTSEFNIFGAPPCELNEPFSSIIENHPDVKVSTRSASKKANIYIAS